MSSAESKSQTGADGTGSSSNELAETHVPSGGGKMAETQIPDSAGTPAPKKSDPAFTGDVTRAARDQAAKSSSAGAAEQGSKAAGDVKKVSQLGDFKLVKNLGLGGMGTVYLATQVSLDRKVALKTLSKEFSKKEDFVKRFIREARSMARLQHPNIVQVYAADSAHGIHYAAIEFIDGRSMQNWMDEKKRLSVGDALYVTLVCAAALKHAHDENMIHRDIKPDNILVTSKGVVKVADFGLAKALDEDVSMTQSGTGLGTPLYMAPEQARNAKHVDKRSDIYALGSTLYYFLTGELPFTGSTTLELILAKEKGQFKAARKINTEVPERLDLMIDKMMAKDPGHRYADCGEIIRDLQGLNLANSSLSFIQGAAATVIPVGVTAASTAKTKLPPPREAPISSAEDAARTQSKVVMPGANEEWIVRYALAGKVTVGKMTTAQIIASLKGGTLDLQTKIKKNTKDQFLPVAQFPQFADVADKRAVRDKVEAHSRDVQSVYAKIDKQERRRKRWRWLSRLFSGVKGLVSLILWLAFVGFVIFAAFYWGWPFLKPYISDFFKG